MNFEERNKIVRRAIGDDDLDTIERVHPNAFVLNQQLFRAIETENLREIQLLIEAGADVNLPEIDQNCLINPDLPATIQNIDEPPDARRHGKRVVDFGECFVNYEDRETIRLPLFRAIIKGNFEIAKYLIDKGATANDVEAIQVAINFNNKVMIRYLLENPDLWFTGRPTYGEAGNYLNLYVPIRDNSLDVMEFLLQSWPTEDFATYHLSKVIGGIGNWYSREKAKASKEMVQLFINNGADVNNSSRSSDSPLIAAFKNGDIEIFKLLLENGAEVNERFMTEFELTVQNTLLNIELGNPNQIFIDTLPEFKRIVEQEQERQRLEKYKRPSDPSWITSASKYQRYQFEQVLKSFNLSQLKRVYQKVYGKKCPVKSKKAILKILQRK